MKVKQVDLAEEMIRAIARQAEVERERRAKIIHTDGEYPAAEKLSMVAAVLQRQPVAVQLRYLQMLVEIGSEQNTTIVSPARRHYLVLIPEFGIGGRTTGIWQVGRAGRSRGGIGSRRGSGGIGPAKFNRQLWKIVEVAAVETSRLTLQLRYPAIL